MRTIVLNSSQTLKAVLSSAVSTNQPVFHLNYVDNDGSSAFDEVPNQGTFNGVTEVTLASAPASGTKRTIKDVNIYNADDADIEFELYKDEGGTTTTILKDSINPGDQWTPYGVYDSSGKLKTSTTASSSDIATAIGGVSTVTDPTDSGLFSVVISGALRAITWASLKSVSATFTNKVLTALSNTIYADQIHSTGDNETGSTLSAGKAVYSSGYNVGNDAIEVSLADNTSAATLAKGLVFEDIANGNIGAIVENGFISGLDTSSYSLDDPLYLSTNGDLTNVKPTSGWVQEVAEVVRVNAGNGVLKVGVKVAYAVTPSNDGDIGSKKYIDDQDATKADLSGGNTFSGVQDFSNRIDSNAGISFDGGTNVLSEYESGTFTLEVRDQSNNTLLDSSTMYYERIGDRVFVTGTFNLIDVSGATTSAILEFTGLPFTDVSGQSSPIGRYRDANITSTVSTFTLGNGGFYLYTEGSQVVREDDFISGSTRIYFNFNYRV